MFPNSSISLYARRMITGEYAPIPPKRPGFQVDLARKDCRHALDIARKAGVRLGVVELMYGHLTAAKEIGGDNMDIRYFISTVKANHKFCIRRLS